MGAEIDRLHHVGLVVHDLASCMALYRRLGFTVGTATCPMIAMGSDVSPKPFGVANAHVKFPRNFVELVTADSKTLSLPEDVEYVPMRVSEAALPALLQSLHGTVARLTLALSRFEGLAILVLGTSSIARSVASLDASGEGHGTVATVARDAKAPQHARTSPIQSFEIDRDPLPEGRLAVAESPFAESECIRPEFQHPNGATALVGVILCVAPADLDKFEARYARYLGRQAKRTDSARIFELDDTRITIVSPDGLTQILPGERVPSLPAFVGYTVAVRDQDEVEALLRRNGLPTAMSSSGNVFVPSAAARGAAVIFQASQD